VNNPTANSGSARFIHFMVWMPWVHWWWRPYSEKTVTDKVTRWLCFELKWNL